VKLVKVKPESKLRPRSGPDDVIQPPATVQVAVEPRIILYTANETPLKREIGFSRE